MASSADLVINVLANTGGATQDVNRLVDALGKVAGLGAGGAAAAEMVKASMSQQDAMARIQTAYNSVDFAPGTAKFEAAHDKLVDWSTRLATPFSVLAETYGQGARFLDEFGNKLSPEKLDEYTESVTRLSKVSKDLDPTRAGQLVETLAKVYRTEDFKGITSASTALSGIHNMGEGPALEGAIAIGQYGAQLGVRPEQALGIANALVDVGMSGQLGAGGMGAAGSSIGRMLMLMDQSADSILDPSASYKDAKRQREADEKVSDLNDSLEEAQAKESEMYDSRGRLKRQYIRHPSEKLAMDHRIAKLQRERDDASQDLAHIDDLGTGGLDSIRGRMNVKAMSATAGMDTTEYAELFKEDPMEALLRFTGGIGNLDPSKRGEALRNAGVRNTRDLKVLELLSDRSDVVRQNIGVAGDQLANPTDLTTRSDIALSTTSAHVQDAANAVQAGAAALGDQPRQLLDAGTTKLVDEIHANSDALGKLNTVLTGTDWIDHIAGGIIAGGVPLLGSIVTNAALVKILTAGSGGAAAAGAAAGAARGAAGAVPMIAGNVGAIGAGAALIGAGATAAAAVGAGQLGAQLGRDHPLPIPEDWKPQAGQVAVDVGGIHIDFGALAYPKQTAPEMVGQAAQQAAQQVYSQIIAAWQQSQNTPSSQLGGAR